MELMLRFTHGEYFSLAVKQAAGWDPDPLRALWRKDKYPAHAAIESRFLGRRGHSIPSSKSAVMRHTRNYALSSSQ